MQPIFDLKGDNSQRADVSGSLGKLAYKIQFVWIARISNVRISSISRILVFMRDKDYKISKTSTDLLYG